MESKGVLAMISDGGRRGRFKIRGVYYPTYRTVRAEVLRRLAKYSSKAPEDLNEDDAAWFVELIREMHPYAGEKLSKPVVGVRRYNRYGHQGNNLLLMYADGSSLPFSWNKCCKGKKSSDGVSVKTALRAAVADQTSAVMDAAFAHSETIACPMSGDVITRRSSHVDHAPPKFADLVQAWLIDRDIQLDDVPLADDPQGGQILALGEARDSWRRFHKQNAVLRVVSARWNTSAEARR
jgi:hypothetical protein